MMTMACFAVHCWAKYSVILERLGKISSPHFPAIDRNPDITWIVVEGGKLSDFLKVKKCFYLTMKAIFEI